jgi:hypothetical protein
MAAKGKVIAEVCRRVVVRAEDERRSTRTAGEGADHVSLGRRQESTHRGREELELQEQQGRGQRDEREREPVAARRDGGDVTDEEQQRGGPDELEAVGCGGELVEADGGSILLQRFGDEGRDTLEAFAAVRAGDQDPIEDRVGRHLRAPRAIARGPA